MNTAIKLLLTSCAIIGINGVFLSVLGHEKEVITPEMMFGCISLMIFGLILSWIAIIKRAIKKEEKALF